MNMFTRKEKLCQYTQCIFVVLLFLTSLYYIYNYIYFLVFIKPYIKGLHDDKIGIFFLGCFVGWVLGIGIQQSKINIKTVLTIIGTALSGAPVILLQNIDDRWFYPIGLVTGLLWIRIKSAREEIIEHDRNTRNHRFVRLFSYIDLIVISIFSLLAIIYAILIEG